MFDQCGTPAYISPEILKGVGYEGFPVDLWSAGVVLYTMLTGNVPFKANNMNELQKMIIKGSVNPIKEASVEANHLISCLLDVDPKKRFTSEDVLCHPWMNDQVSENGMLPKSKLF